MLLVNSNGMFIERVRLILTCILEINLLKFNIQYEIFVFMLSETLKIKSK